MRRCAIPFLILLAVSVFVLVPPATVAAGNLQPTLYLEIYGFDAEPTDTLPEYVCTHETTFPGSLVPCSAAKSPYGYGFLAVHVGRIDLPTCSTVGPECEGYGGFTGLCFGVIQAGEPALYLNFTVCPGFISGYSGGPGDIVVLTAPACHDWHDHPGYLKYFNLSADTGPTYFRIVKNSELGFARVINCSMEYDLGTVIGGCAVWGGEVYSPEDCSPTPGGEGMAWYLCGLTPVDPTTWGAVKALYR